MCRADCADVTPGTRQRSPQYAGKHRANVRPPVITSMGGPLPERYQQSGKDHALPSVPWLAQII
jgi:hypothetical protein